MTLERIRREVREVGLVTLYFLAWFLLFLTLKKLLLAQYQLQTAVLSTAAVGALIVAKVVVLLEKTSFGSRFRGDRVFLHVAWRSCASTAVVFLVTLAERLLDAYGEKGELPAAIWELWARRDVHHFLALNIVVGLAFLFYNTFAEIDRRLGPGGLRRLLFER